MIEFLDVLTRVIIICGLIAVLWTIADGIRNRY